MVFLTHNHESKVDLGKIELNNENAEMDFYVLTVMYFQGTFMKIGKLSIKKLVGGIKAILIKLCTVCAHFCQFFHLNCTEQARKINALKTSFQHLHYLELSYYM